MEMVVIIVVISISATGLFGVLALGVGRSADPMLQVQAIAIAQGYLEEILLKNYNDPDGLPDVGGRANYDDVVDYNGLNDTAGAQDQFGNPLIGLGQYNVGVTVTATNLGGGALLTPARRIDVVVTHDSQASLSINLTGYKTNY